MSAKPYFIQGMWGFGDNIYQRPFIRMLNERTTVFLDTPWPELYEDLSNVKFVRGARQLRTQLKNIGRQSATRWSKPPPGAYQLNFRIHYNLQHHSIIEEMAGCFRIGDRVELDLPAPKKIWTRDKPIALIRPVTFRREWCNTARNPMPEYINWIANELMKTHCVIAVADLLQGHEEMIGDPPPCHEAWFRGEVETPHLIDLIQSADVLVGGVGWIVPAAVAARKRAFIVLGGHGGHNAPEKILAPWWKHQITFATPDQFCRCTNMRHQCQKTISNLSERFSEFNIRNSTI